MDECICTLLTNGDKDLALDVLGVLHDNYVHVKLIAEYEQNELKQKQQQQGMLGNSTPRRGSSVTSRLSATPQQRQIMAKKFGENTKPPPLVPERGRLLCLDEIVYNELEVVVDGDGGGKRDHEVSWLSIANCLRGNSRRYPIELEIRTSMMVKTAILKSVVAIDLDERAEFDWYC